MSKLDGIKAGDRVRVTFEGVADSGADAFGDVPIRCDGVNGVCWLMAYRAASPTFQITRIEPAFKLGDAVRGLGDDSSSVPYSNIVAFLSDGRAVVEYQAGDTTNVCARHPSALTHA